MKLQDNINTLIKKQIMMRIFSISVPKIIITNEFNNLDKNRIPLDCVDITLDKNKNCRGP